MTKEKLAHLGIRLIAVGLLALATGCSGEEPEPASPGFRYSHTVDYSGFCGELRSTSPAVRLRCEPGGELVESCGADAGAVDVFAKPGAGDGQPFGVATFVEFEGC